MHDEIAIVHVVFEMQNLLVGYIEFKDACVHDKDLCELLKHSGKA
jgi:hypothetical protein